jgi:hypothetical protein
LAWPQTAKEQYSCRKAEASRPRWPININSHARAQHPCKFVRRYLCGWQWERTGPSPTGPPTANCPSGATTGIGKGLARRLSFCDVKEEKGQDETSWTGYAAHSSLGSNSLSCSRAASCTRSAITLALVGRCQHTFAPSEAEAALLT